LDKKKGGNTMKMILAFVLTALVVPASLSSVKTQKSAEQSGWSANVFSQPGHEVMASVGLLRTQPLVSAAKSGPNCGVYVFQITERWLDPKIPPRAPNGGLVSEFIFKGWMEHGKAKVIVWALVNDKDATDASTDEKKLTGQPVDTLLIEPGKSVMVNGLLQYGAKPVEVSIARTQ
jgi:hypothetical protein